MTLEQVVPSLPTGGNFQAFVMLPGDSQFVGADGPIVFVHDMATGERVAELPELGDRPASLSVSPDGARLAGATAAGTALVWDTTTWEVADELPGEAVALRYSPDGGWLVTVRLDGVIELRDPVTLEVRDRLTGSGGVDFADNSLWFSGDGRHLLTGADAVQMWDLDELAPIGDPFPNGNGMRAGGADGLPLQLVTGLDDSILVWNLDVNTWPEIACQAAGRNMTLEEWEQFGPQGEPYRATCRQWPSLG